MVPTDISTSLFKGSFSTTTLPSRCMHPPPLNVCTIRYAPSQFGILPPKVVPLSRSMRTLPRKERKEMQKSLKGAKQFHTSTSLTTLSQIGTPSSPYELLPIGDNVSLPVRWGTGGLSRSTGAANAITESDVESRWRGPASIETGPTGLEIIPNVLPSSLTEVLNSHLSLLGPTAVSRLSGIGGIDGSSRSQCSGTATGFWENILRRFGWE